MNAGQKSMGKTQSDEGSDDEYCPQFGMIAEGELENVNNAKEIGSAKHSAPGRWTDNQWTPPQNHSMKTLPNLVMGRLPIWHPRASCNTPALECVAPE